MKNTIFLSNNVNNMKKLFLFAIATFCVWSFASCSKETECPVESLHSAKLTVTLGESTKATMTNPTSTGAGFVFQAGDVINWVSKSGNATYTYTGEDAKSITFDVEIPGLEAGDVEGYFAVNFTDEVPYCFNASNTTQAQAGINSNCFFLSSYTKTLLQGSTSVSVYVKPVGGVFAFQFKGADDKVFKVEVGAENTWCNNASFDGYALVLDPIMSKLATNVDVEMTDAYDTQCIFVPVPSGITLDEPYVKIYAKSGIYTYDFGGTDVAPEGDLTFEDAVIKKIKLPLDESLCDKFEKWPKGSITLTAECISSNDPMQYVIGGSDIYGLQSNPDWFTAITGTQSYVREQKYGKATNMWDDDSGTSYHTNLDWGQPNTSWGQRSYSINPNRAEKRYIQVTLPAAMDKFDIEFTNADSGAEAEGLELLVTTDGSNWTKVPDTDFSADFGAENSAEDVSAGGALITALRIQNTKADADWTYIKAAFGIAELAIYGQQRNLTDPGKVTGITLAPTSASLSIGESTNLTATVLPSTAEIEDVVWISSDPSVATVDDGTVTAVAEGIATITAKTVDGGFTASCEVNSLPD